jgi:hypothetical protein
MNALVPFQRWTRDDWVLPCNVRDPGGQPINLTGFIIGAELYLSGYNVAQPLVVANGGIERVSDPNGQFRVIVPRTLTARAPESVLTPKPNDRTRVVVYWIDTYGHRQTLGAIPFEVFDGRESVAINEIPSLVIIAETPVFNFNVATEQGIPGPSNIPAEQITDGTPVGRSILTAADAAAIRSILGVPSVTPKRINDANYSISVKDTYVAFAGDLTAPRTLVLPPAAQYPSGQPLTIADETGDCSTETGIYINKAGTDKVNGQDYLFIASPYQKIVLYSNGVGLWIS